MKFQTLHANNKNVINNSATSYLPQPLCKSKLKISALEPVLVPDQNSSILVLIYAAHDLGRHKSVSYAVSCSGEGKTKNNIIMGIKG